MTPKTEKPVETFGVSQQLGHHVYWAIYEGKQRDGFAGKTPLAYILYHADAIKFKKALDLSAVTELEQRLTTQLHAHEDVLGQLEKAQEKIKSLESENAELKLELESEKLDNADLRNKLFGLKDDL